MLYSLKIFSVTFVIIKRVNISSEYQFLFLVFFIISEWAFESYAKLFTASKFFQILKVACLRSGASPKPAAKIHPLLLFSEINVIVNTLPIDQEALDLKVKKYLSLGNDTRELYEKISSLEERQLIDYFIAKEPSVSSKKLKEAEADKPKKKKIKVKAKDKSNDKSKPKAKAKAGKAKQSGGGTKDKNKSLETVIETIDLLDNSEQEAPEVSEGIEADNETKTIVINETESTGEEESPKSELNEIEDDTFGGISNDTFTDADDELEEVQLVGGDTEAPSSVDSDVKQFKIDSLDLDDDLDALANYVEEESDASDTESEADFTETYRENSMDGLDTAEKIPLDIDLNSAQVNKEKEPQIPVVNVVKLGQ